MGRDSYSIVRREWRALLGLAAVGFLVFAGSLWAGFTFDDQIALLDNPAIRHWHFWDLWTQGWLRQVRTLSFMLDHALFGFAPWGYHLQNLFWHVLVVLLLFFIVRRLAGRSSTAFLVALLFSLEPIHVEAVVNVTNRKELLCMAFSLLSWLCYMHGLDPSSQNRVGWFAGAIATYALALFSKQVAVALPLAVVAWEWLFVPRKERLLLRRPVWLAVGAGLAATLLWIWLSRQIDLSDLAGIRTLRGYTGSLSIASVLRTSPIAFWIYVKLMLWPVGLCPDHLVRLSESLFEPRTLAAGSALLLVLLATLRWARRFPLLAFGVLWLLIQYLPVSNLVPSSYIVADRYMYIPSAGLLLALVRAGEILRQKVAATAPALAAGLSGSLLTLLIVGYAAQTLSYSALWMNEQILWESTLRCNGKSFRAYNALGNNSLESGAYPEAIRHFNAAIRLGYVGAWCARGSVYYEMGQFEKAVEDCTRAIRIHPDRPVFFYNRGNAYSRLARFQEAIADYTRALELRPNFADSLYNRSLAYRKQGRPDRAREDLAAAARLGSSLAHRALHTGPK